MRRSPPARTVNTLLVPFPWNSRNQQVGLAPGLQVNRATHCASATRESATSTPPAMTATARAFIIQCFIITIPDDPIDTSAPAAKPPGAPARLGGRGMPRTTGGCDKVSLRHVSAGSGSPESPRRGRVDDTTFHADCIARLAPMPGGIVATVGTGPSAAAPEPLADLRTRLDRMRD